MSAGELLLFLVGLAALVCYLWSVQYLGKIWTNHLERVENLDSKMLLELMACHDKLSSLLRAVQNQDK